MHEELILMAEIPGLKPTHKIHSGIQNGLEYSRGPL